MVQEGGKEYIKLDQRKQGDESGQHLDSINMLTLWGTSL
jgi:hypothetical protein